LVSQPIINYLRIWDRKAAEKPDSMIAISTEVQKRIKKYYGRKTEVIFPPVKLTVNRSSGSNYRKYFLIVSRLVGYKKVDLAIKAFNILGYPLVVIGTGREESRLKSLSNKNIKFVGQISDKISFTN